MTDAPMPGGGTHLPAGGTRWRGDGGCSPRGPAGRSDPPAGWTFLSGALAALLLASPLPAQVVTGGAGVLLSDGPATPVAELHAAAPPLAGIRPYLTLSWTNEDLHPTAITAAEATVLRTPASITGLGAGLLWVEDGGYRAHSMLVSSTVVPLPLPRTSAVAIGSTLPFHDFRWSLVLKVGVRLLP